MPKNYRNRRSPSRSRTTKNQMNVLVWIVLGILIGLLVAAFLYLKQVAAPHTTVATQVQKTAAHIPVSNNAKKPTSQQQAAAGPEFDFYTVLPKMQVTPNKAAASTAKPIAPPVMPAAPPPATNATPAMTTTLPALATPAPATTTSPADIISNTPPPPAAIPATNPTNSHYWLQIVSLKNFADADRYKAELTMSGLDVTIQSYTKNSQTYNRVVMGPYDSRQAAQQQQAQLKQKNIESIVVKTP